jgi:ATPase subunit of ABC transporter with duplicated ATPase domains
MRKELAWLGRGAPARSTKPKFRIDAANELIANEPPPRDKVTLASMAMQRLGKDVVDLENVSVSYDDKATGQPKQVLKDVTWRIAPGERTGILGVNGAGKSTLLSLVAGSLEPTTGKVKRGKTIKVATLTQQLGELEDIWDDRVSEVLGRQKSSYVAGGKEMTPTQLLERVGFASAQLSTRVRELSGGQKRRLQLLLIILDEPNVLILDEPTNDLDTDMLAAIEDLLDSYPGTLLVVSHDRYLLERVTDQQYAVMHGAMRHLPRGVDQYLEIRMAQLKADAAPAASSSSSGAAKASKLGGAELRNAQKEFSAAERKLAKMNAQVSALHEKMAAHDQGDYTGLGTITTEIQALEAQILTLENRWLELEDLLN